MPKELEEKQIDTWGKMLRIHSNSTVQIELALAKENLIPLTWYDVLLVLSKAEGERLRLSDIATRVVLTRSGLSRRISNLEKKGLIRRETCEHDRRGAYAVLTSKGKNELKAAWPVYKSGIIENFLNVLTKSDIANLDRIFSKILEEKNKN